MKHFVGLCLFIATLSLHTAILPAENAGRDMSTEEKINNTIRAIDRCYKELNRITKDLMDMKIWIVPHKDGSIALHCKSVNDEPYIIAKGENPIPALAECFKKNDFNNKEKWKSDDLVREYFFLSDYVIELEEELTFLRKRLNQYKKPALRHQTT